MKTKQYKPSKREVEIAKKGLKANKDKNKEQFDKIKKFLKTWKSKNEFKKEFPNDILLSQMISASYIAVEKRSKNTIFYKINKRFWIF